MQRLSATLSVTALAAALLVLASPRPACALSFDDNALIREEQLLFPSRGQLKPSSLEATQAAQTAINYLNSDRGSPSSLRKPGYVKRASVKSIPGVGHKYFLQFTTKDFLNGQNLGLCLATVTYRKRKPKPVVFISCSKEKDTAQRLKEDYDIYRSLRDSFGTSKASSSHLWALGTMGSSYIAWEKATEDGSYVMTDMADVKPWKRGDGSLEYDYKAVLLKGFSQFLSCHVRLTWKPEQPAKVKYDCSSVDESAESADGSGGEIELASGFFIQSENNF
uniref:Retinoic acid receptor responder 1 n=1 Tax=Salvator merianae TaxID=96440 RepID=A0A8D0BBR3_SALMN